MNKKTSIIGIIILIVIFGLGWFFLMKQSAVSPIINETATTTQITSITPQAKISTEGWKICRNEKYGYEFKYPNEWSIDGDDGSGSSAYSKKVKICEGLNPAEPFNEITSSTTEYAGRLFVNSNTSFENLPQVTSSTSVTALAEILKINSLNEYNVDGRRALLSIKKDSAGNNYYELRLKSTETIFDINGYQITLELFDTILSTFKFLK